MILLGCLGRQIGFLFMGYPGEYGMVYLWRYEEWVVGTIEFGSRDSSMDWLFRSGCCAIDNE